MKAIWCPDSSLVSGAHLASRILSSESLLWQLGTRGATLRHASVDWWFYTHDMVADSLVSRLSVSLLFYMKTIKGMTPPLAFLWKSYSASRLRVFSRKLKCMSHGPIGSSLQGWRDHELHSGCINDAPNSKIQGLIYKARV